MSWWDAQVVSPGVMPRQMPWVGCSGRLLGWDAQVGSQGGMPRRAALHSSAGVRPGLRAIQLVPLPGGGTAAYAWHMSAPASRTARALLPTCSPPLCAQQGLLRPRNRVTTANFESADQSGMIWASPGTGLQLGWSGRAKKR